MYTIGELTKDFGLSRSTILYYDKIGLLKPTERAKNNYRRYSDEDRLILADIIRYRETGISLEDIRKLLDMNRTNITEILTDRLKHIQTEMKSLKKQEVMIIEVMINEVAENMTAPFNRVSWTNLLRNIGYSDEDMYEWHKNFEMDNPIRHMAFLKALGFTDEKISAFRDKLTE